MIRSLESHGYDVTFRDELMRSVGQHYFNIPYSLLVARLNQLTNPVNFIQVGAFDGDSHDPLVEAIRNFPMQGALIEPQSGPFAKL